MLGHLISRDDQGLDRETGLFLDPGLAFRDGDQGRAVWPWVPPLTMTYPSADPNGSWIWQSRCWWHSGDLPYRDGSWQRHSWVPSPHLDWKIHPDPLGHQAPVSGTSLACLHPDPPQGAVTFSPRAHRRLGIVAGGGGGAEETAWGGSL